MGHEDAPGARVDVVVVDGGCETTIARLRGLWPDVGLIGSLAGLHLSAKRLGIDVRLRHPCPTLARMIELAGLTDALVGSPAEAPMGEVP